jgi:MFS transporter, DHA2 family, methylenomycin A resistance protein
VSEEPVDAVVESGAPARQVGRFTVPDFVMDLGREPGALAALVAGGLALFVAGLDPKVFGPGTPDMQRALRERPALENLFLLAVVVQAAFYLVGGAAGDILGSRRVLLAGLAALVVSELMAVIWDDGALFFVARIASAASIGLVIPTAIATVAMAYTGATRATALGAAYAMLGLSSAIAPALLSAVTPSIGRWPSFAVVALVAIVAFVVARRGTSVFTGHAPRAEFVIGHGLWAFGLLSMTSAVVGLSGGTFSPLRLVLLVGGAGVIIGFLVWQRRVRHRMDPTLAIDLRPVTIALFAGVVVAFAQIAPSLEAPVFFRVVQGWGSLAATIAIAPFVIALLVAGPVAGILLRRYRPRTLVAGGMLVLGLGDLAFALVNPSTPYLYFIVPFVAIGAGFVIATTVRTAIIFASVPRRLPSTAAALNQTSLLIGSQLGVAVVTTLVATFSTQELHNQLASTSSADQATTLADFATYLQAVGTSTFGSVIDSLDPALTAQFGAAYGAGLAVAIAFMGGVTMVGAVIAWLGMGRSDAVVSVWEHRDERGTAPESAPAA